MTMLTQPSILYIGFVLNASTGRAGPTFSVQVTGDPTDVVRSMIGEAIKAGGVWDNDRNNFFPWHSVACVKWGPDRSILDEEAIVQEGSLARRLEQAFSKPI
jgi:hypothetical protein